MRAIFGAIITVFLLIVYVGLIWFGIEIIACEIAQECTSRKAENFNENMSSALALIGGLVSALVVSELAATSPGEMPGARLLAPEVDRNSAMARRLEVVVVAYMIVWTAAGAAVFVYAYLLNPKALPPLTNLGQAWLGIAVGAAYAYLGIKPKKR